MDSSSRCRFRPSIGGRQISVPKSVNLRFLFSTKPKAPSLGFSQRRSNYGTICRSHHTSILSNRNRWQFQELPRKLGKKKTGLVSVLGRLVVVARDGSFWATCGWYKNDAGHQSKTMNVPSPDVVQYTIPDILARFPWPRILSEHYDEAKAESSAWTEAFHFFDEDGLKGFNSCDFNLLASLAYSPRDYTIVRLGCDMMNLFYVFDEYTDIEDGPGAFKIHEIVMDAFRNPEKPRPEGELLIGEMARDFWLRCSSIVPPGSPCLKHMIDTWHTYTAAVAIEADDRSQRLYRDFEGYLTLRRDTSGCLPSFALHEFGLDLPEEAYQHPMMEEIRDQANLLISLGNDIGSYALEKERGLDTHNSIALVMQEHNLDLDGAIKWIEEYAMRLHDGFLDNIKNFPSYGADVDRRIKVYFDGVAQWVRGNDDWTYESGRYFGDKGLVIKKTRVMCFSPPPSGYVKKSASA